MHKINKLIYVISFLISCVSLNGFAIDFLSTEKTSPKKELIIFSATWCPPCKIVKNELKNKNSSLSKIVSKFDVTVYDYDLDKNKFKSYNVSKVPTFIVKDNESENRMTGIPKGVKELINFLKTNE